MEEVFEMKGSYIKWKERIAAFLARLESLGDGNA